MTSRIRVLLIDDETVFVDALTKVLTRRGIRCRAPLMASRLLSC